MDELLLYYLVYRLDESSPLTSHENDEIIVDPTVSCPILDNTREAVMLVAMLKDGKVIKMFC